jgi:polysaccharide pyruvyl transferase WcaK-like protein
MVSLSEIINPRFRKIVLLSTSGYGNIGQETITTEIINEILALGYVDKITLNSYNPHKSKTLNKSKKVRFYKNSSIFFFTSLIESDIVIIAGDELSNEKLTEYYNKIDYFQGKVRLFLSLFAILLGKPLILYKVGLYSYQKNFPKGIFKVILKRSLKIIVRDNLTKNKLLKDYNALNRRICICPDPGYSLSYYHTKPIKERRLGLCLSYFAIKENEVNLIKFLKNNETKFDSFYFFVFGAHEKIREEKDILVAKKILSKLNIRAVVYSNQNPKKVKSMVAKMRFVVSMRYHGAIFADACKIPFLVLPTSKKMYAFKKNIISFNKLSNLDL